MLHSTDEAAATCQTGITLTTSDALVTPHRADTDATLIDLWLHGRSRHTQKAYRADVGRLLTCMAKPLHDVTLGDLQKFADDLTAAGLAPASAHRCLSAVKSLFTFGHKLGYLPYDVARPLRLPGLRDGLACRILDESEVHRMLALERQPRNHALLILLYAAGLRVSEACSLTWSDLQPRVEGGQVTVTGKRMKTRTILLPASVWHKVQSLRGEADDRQPVFRSRKRGHLTPSQVWRVVRKAARRAAISKNVSSHWLRHASASHALNRGAPVHLVQATLGHSSVATTGKYLHARPDDSSARYLGL
jgi:site-specific recombinase XerD